MPIDPLLVNGIVPVISPVQAEAQAMSLRDMMSQNAMQQEQLKALQMQNAQTAQARARDQQYREYVMNQARLAQQAGTLAPAAGIQGLLAGPQATAPQVAMPQAQAGAIDESGQPDGWLPTSQNAGATAGPTSSQTAAVPQPTMPTAPALPQTAPAMPGRKVGAVGPAAGYDWRTEVQNLRSLGLVDQANAIQKGGIENDTKLAEAAKNQAEAENDQMSALEKRHGAVAGALKTILDADPADRPAIYQQLRARMASEGHLSPSEMPDSYPGDQAVQALAGQMTDLGKQLDVAKDKRAARMDTLDRELKDAQARQAQLAAYAQEHPDDEQAQNLALTAQQRVENAQKQAAQVETARHNVVDETQGKQRIGMEGARLAEDKRLHDMQYEDVKLDGPSLDKVATYFARTGQLPALGMGAAAAGQRSRIIQRATELFPNSDIASSAASYAADKKSLAAATGMRDNVNAFAQTALGNLQLFEDAAKKLPDSGVPWINTPVRLLNDKMVGSQNMATVNAARQVTFTEIAKIQNSPALQGALSDSARKEVMDLSPRDATIPQILAVSRLVKKELTNRQGSLNDEVDAISKRIGGGSGAPAAASKDPLGVR